MLKRKFIDVAGIKTGYLEKGQGDALILVHGGQYGSYYTSYAWSRNIEGLSKHFHVYAIDKLGMGYTDNPPSDNEYTFEATVRHLYGFIQSIGLRKFSLAGHSRGGLAVTCLALEHPEKVKKLIIVDSHTTAPEDSSIPEGEFYAKIEWELPPVPTRESVQKEPEANSFSREHITDDLVEDIYNVALLPKTLEAKGKMKQLARKIFYPGMAKMKEKALKQIETEGLRQPVLVVWGLNDPSAPVKLGLDLFKLIAAKTPESQFHVFNQAGHYTFREHPEEFNRVITTFLR